MRFAWSKCITIQFSVFGVRVVAQDSIVAEVAKTSALPT